MTDGVLASFEPIYAAMGSLGWSPVEVDAMDCWHVARFLGDDDFDPVIRGSRSLRIPSDDDDKKGSKMGRFNPKKAKAKRNERGQMVDSGRIFTGDAAR